MLGSGANGNRGSALLPSDMPSLPQCLPLDPILLGNQKFTRAAEVRRVLGVNPGIATEDYTFGSAHPKHSPPVVREELKHFKESVQDASRKARDRAKLLRDSLFKLDKYSEALSSKKRQRCELSSSERPGGVSLVKIGGQIHRNSHENVAQRSDERTKSAGLNKRVRSSAADFWVSAESRAATTSRHQTFSEKDSDASGSVGVGSVRTEEKTRKLLAGGEGLDHKVKKKRSVGAVGNRIMNGERETKQTTVPKLNADSKLRSSDAQIFRLKSSPGVRAVNRLDNPSKPAALDACNLMKNESDGVPSVNDRNVVLEQRAALKGKIKKNVQNISISNPSTLMKGRITRAPRTGSIVGLESSSSGHSPSGAQGWEPTNLGKTQLEGATNNQKRPFSAGSSMHPMTQWIGQRPHKNSRTRRANLVSPVSNYGETQLSARGTESSDLNPRTLVKNCSVIPCSVDNSTPNLKEEIENDSYPLRVSESEDSGAGDDKLKEKDTDIVKAGLNADHLLPSMFPVKKNKILTNEIGNGVRRQGRCGRYSSLARPGFPLVMEKSDLLTTKPIQGKRSSSEKNKSKSGRPPVKKLKDRKTSIRIGLTSDSSDLLGESDDDQEELFMAAKSARTASDAACSGPFWKEMEFIFAAVNSEDKAFLSRQLQLGNSEELDESFSQMLDNEHNILGVIVHEEAPNSSGIRQVNDSIKESYGYDTIRGGIGMGKMDKVTPLYQRVLSALIEDHESDPCYQQSEGKSMSLQCGSDDSHCGSCNPIDSESRDRDRTESEAESRVNCPTKKNCLFDRISCEKSIASNAYRNQSTCSSIHSSEQCLTDDDSSLSEIGLVNEISSNYFGLPRSSKLSISGFSSDCQYQAMPLNDRLLLELQSIGLYPETLPDLTEGEELISQDIMELEEGLHQQIGRKKNNLVQVDKSIEMGRDTEKRRVEQVAMDQLIEMAYRKRLAFRGNSSKSTVRKVSQQMLLAFINRTLGRCKKFEATGFSCFSEPAMQDILFSATPGNNDTKSIECVLSGSASNTFNEVSHQMDARGSALTNTSEQASSRHRYVLTNKGKKREAWIDQVVASASSRVTSTVVDGAKEKRDERERDQGRENLRSNSVSEGGITASEGPSYEQRTRTKPRQKLNSLSDSGSAFPCGLPKAKEPRDPSVLGANQSDGNSRNKRSGELGSVPIRKNPPEPGKDAGENMDLDNLQLHELDSMEDWLNFDEEGLQEDDCIGLEIPMDDLSELNMLM